MVENNELEMNLKNLFKEWKVKQKNEKGYDWRNTGIAIGSFTIDGIVNEECWYDLVKKEKNKVLYILREANGNASEMGMEGKEVDGDNFWFQKCVTENKVSDNIFQRIKEMQMIIQGYTGVDVDSTKEILREVAYMNLNKRGGGASVDWKIFNDYIKEYKEYIKKEIAIIKPDIIVCCGTYWSLIDNVCGLYKNGSGKKWKTGDDRDFDYVGAVIKDENGNELHKARIINMYHPSARISNANYIKRFRKIYGTADSSNNDSVSLVLSKQDIYKTIKKMNKKSEEFCELCDLINNIEESLADKKLEVDK